MSLPVVLSLPTAIGELHQDPDGALQGWCWYPDQPLLRATVELLRDGEVVRAIRATRLRTDFREHGMGDGHCGFWFLRPADTLPNGSRVVLEVRERRLGTTIGRIVVGSSDPVLERRLGAAGSSLALTAAALDSLNPDPGPAAVLGVLGRTLLYLSSRPKGQRVLGLPGLQAGLQQVASVPATDLGWCTKPRLSLIVSADNDDFQDLAGRLRGAAYALRGLNAEFLLVDDGSMPLAMLLPTRLRGLILVRAATALGPGSGLNAAAAAARGAILAVARPGGPGMADLDNVVHFPSGTLGLDAAIAPSAAIAGPMRRHGLHCVISRADLAAMGGFDPWAEGATLWGDLLAKAEALGFAIATWNTPQKASLPGRQG